MQVEDWGDCLVAPIYRLKTPSPPDNHLTSIKRVETIDIR